MVAEPRAVFTVTGKAPLSVVVVAPAAWVPAVWLSAPPVGPVEQAASFHLDVLGAQPVGDFRPLVGGAAAGEGVGQGGGLDGEGDP